MDQKINQLYEEGKVDQAIHALIEKIDHNPRETANYLQLATYLLDQGSAEQARELLTKARGIAEDPQAWRFVTTPWATLIRPWPAWPRFLMMT